LNFHFQFFSEADFITSLKILMYSYLINADFSLKGDI